MSVSTNSLLQNFTVNSVSVTVDTDTYINVVKRIENIVYRSSLLTGASGIAYINGNTVSSSNNLSIADRSTSLVANRVTTHNSTTISSSKTFTINTENFVVTDVFTTSSETVEGDPLYYKHTLDTTLVPRNSSGDLDTDVSVRDIQILDTSLQAVKTPDIYIDYTKGIIYNNLSPSFTDSGNYIVYYVKFTVNNDGDISTHVNLLNNTTVYTLAEFSDLDDSLVIKTDGRKVYLVEEVSDGYEITLPVTGTYSYKPLSTSRIQILPPVPSGAEDPWFVRVTNGKFYTTIDDILYKYHIAEFLTQSFYPESPIKSVGSEESTILSKNLIKLDRENIYQDSSLDLYINILINKSDGTGVAALTTNPDIVGNISANGQAWTQWSNSTRYGIKSIDHQTGFVDIDGIHMSTSWEATSSYYYKEDTYEFTLVNFNPIANNSLLDQRVVLFIDPDTTTTSKSQTLYYLVVDNTGKVIESNWSNFDNDLEAIPGPPNLPVYYEAFPSWKTYENHLNFRNEETVEVSGLYLILGDITVAPAGRPEQLLPLDARYRGGGFTDTSIDQVRSDNPEAIWLWDDGYWDGIPYPGNASVLVEVPVDVLDGAGGTFTQQEVKNIVNRHIAAGVYSTVRAYGVGINVSGVHPGANSITIDWGSDEY